MSWENSTRNVFFARGLNSLAEVQLDELETQPAVRIMDRLHRIGVVNRNVRYSGDRAITPPNDPENKKWLGTIYVEPLDDRYKPRGLIYREMLRMIIWSPDALNIPNWVANDIRIDLDRAGVAVCQSMINPRDLDASEGGPYPHNKDGTYLIWAGKQYNEDLPALWDANLYEAPTPANLSTFYKLTDPFVGQSITPVTIPVEFKEYAAEQLT